MKTVKTTVTPRQITEAQGGLWLAWWDGDPVWVSCPESYDPAEITAHDVVHDDAIVVHDVLCECDDCLVEVYRWPNVPETAYDDDMPLAGCDPEDADWPAEYSPLVAALIRAYGADPDPEDEFWGLSEEEMFFRLPDGRWGLTGRQIAGCPYVVEACK